MTQQLHTPIPVTVTSDRLPEGVRAQSRKGWCYAWKDTGIDGHRLWVVVLDETGEVVDVPQPEVRVDGNWSYGRREPLRDVDMRASEAIDRAFWLCCPECANQWPHHSASCSRRPVPAGEAPIPPRLNIGPGYCPDCGVKPGRAHTAICPQNRGEA